MKRLVMAVLLCILGMICTDDMVWAESEGVFGAYKDVDALSSPERQALRIIRAQEIKRRGRQPGNSFTTNVFGNPQTTNNIGHQTTMLTAGNVTEVSAQGTGHTVTVEVIQKNPDSSQSTQLNGSGPNSNQFRGAGTQGSP